MKAWAEMDIARSMPCISRNEVAQRPANVASSRPRDHHLSLSG